MTAIKKIFKTRTLSLILALITMLSVTPIGVVNAAENEGIELAASTTYDGGQATTYGSMTVYSNSACTTSSGSLYDNEGFTILNTISSNVFYIEYSTSSGAKKGYIKTSNKNSIDNNSSTSCVAKVKATTDVYYGNSSSTYLKSGSVSKSELVAVLAKSGSWSYIEYNTTGGRKRGYVLNEDLTYYNQPSSYGDFYIKNTSVSTKLSGSYTVYGGPTYRYKSVGSVSKETVTVKEIWTDLEGNETWYIVYSVDGSSQKKSGYIFM